MIQEAVKNQLAIILKPMQGQDGEKEPKLWAKKTRKSKEKSQEEGRKDMLMEKSTSKATCCPEMAFFFFFSFHREIFMSNQCNALYIYPVISLKEYSSCRDNTLCQKAIVSGAPSNKELGYSVNGI